MKKYISFLSLILACTILLSGCLGLRPEDSELTVDEAEDDTKKPDSTKKPTNSDAETADPIPALEDGRTVICLDAGHGFLDAGCDTDYINGNEAEINLAITMLLKAELETRGATVILTHDGKTFPSCDKIMGLADRAGIEYKTDSMIDNEIFSAYERAIYSAAIAEDRAIDLFISLHVNSLEGHPEVSRYEIDYFEGNPYADFLASFCARLEGKLEKKTVVFCDSAENAFIVTKPSTHPSVLIEMGYATSPDDSADLNSNEWRMAFVKNIADSIFESLEEYNK